MRNIIQGDEKINLDEGLFFGKGVFETILCEDKPVFLREHLDRMKKSMEMIGLAPLEEKELIEYIDNRKIIHKVLKITITPMNIIITERELNYKAEDYVAGMKLTVSNVMRNSTSKLSYIKSICYIENLLEKENAKKSGYDDVIFFNEKGYVTETSCANIFILKSNQILTPKVECGLLPGIIRNKIVENFNVVEKMITMQDLKEADEVFITNSIMGIMPVKEINGIKYNSKDKTQIISTTLKAATSAGIA